MISLNKHEVYCQLQFYQFTHLTETPSLREASYYYGDNYISAVC